MERAVEVAEEWTGGANGADVPFNGIPVFTRFLRGRSVGLTADAACRSRKVEGAGKKPTPVTGS